jgi:hypothetical protein
MGVVVMGAVGSVCACFWASDDETWGIQWRRDVVRGRA